MKGTKMSKKTVLRIGILALIIIWTLLIFKLSNQNGGESSNLSRKVAGIFVSDEAIIDIIEPYIRKIAHLSEYAVRWRLIFIVIIHVSVIRNEKNVIFVINRNRVCHIR